MQTMKSTALLVLIFCGIGVAVWATADIVAEARRQQAERDLVDLADACHKRWSKNGRYRPMPKEVRSWLELVEQLDTVIKDVEWYAALIDIESLGDATNNVEEGTGRSYGLGSITLGTGGSICRREGIEVTNLRYALLNPGFNIRLMVLHVEGLYYKYDGDLRRVLLAYNSGEPKADALIAQEEAGSVKLTYTHHLNHKERLEQIRAVIFQQGARR